MSDFNVVYLISLALAVAIVFIIKGVRKYIIVGAALVVFFVWSVWYNNDTSYSSMTQDKYNDLSHINKDFVKNK